MKRRPVAVTLTTDFGTADAYVGAMKGAIHSLAPDAPIFDLTHEIPPFDRIRAALVLRAIAPHFPPGTVHVAIVDPGVGGARDPIVIRAMRQLFVGPDNGIFTFLLDGRHEAWTILPARLPGRSIHPTFHGRDLFAPAAGLLAKGWPPGRIGRPKRSPVLLDLPGVRMERRGRGARTALCLQGAVLHVDHFGNLITNVPEDLLPGSAREGIEIHLGRTTIRGLARTYSDVPIGGALALVGSSGFLEISVREGSAVRRLRARAGAKVAVSLPGVARGGGPGRSRRAGSSLRPRIARARG